jgi:hypothetical protein
MDIEFLEVISTESFNEKYKKILTELDAMHRGVFDDTESENLAAVCLLAELSLTKELAIAEHRMRALKRDIDFAKAKAYQNLKEKKEEGKKITETALSFLINLDENVNELYTQQNDAEKKAKEFSIILGILKDAHLLFRAKSKK